MRWALLLLAVGCVRSNTVQCDDGRTCPFDKVCDDLHDRCVDADQLTTCVGIANGMLCTIDAPNDGLCREGVCLPLECGDGFRTDPEQCDGTEVTPGDDCTTIGYYAGTLTCNAACSYEPTECEGRCGDDIVDVDHDELCDGAPPRQSCVDFGYGAGFLDCLGCGPGVADCKVFGWQQDVMPLAMNDLHGTSDKNIYAVGSSMVMHFDGIAWDPVDLSGCGTLTAQLNAVWTLGADTFVVGTGSVALHITPTGCTKMMVDTASVTLNDVWASSTSDVYATGGAGIFHFDGNAWTKVSTTIRSRVWGSGPNDVWAAGFNTVMHYDGQAWSSPTALAGFTRIDALWGAAANQVYAGGVDTQSGSSVIARYNGATWEPMLREPGGTITAIGGASGRVFAVDFSATGIARVYDGAVWSRFQAPSVSHQWRALYVSDTGTVYALPASELTIQVFYGSIRYDEPVAGITASAAQIDAKTSSDIYLVTANRETYRFNGISWNTEQVADAEDVWVDPASSGEAYVAIPANPPTEQGAIFRRDTTTSPTWVQEANHGGFRIWGSSANDIWTLDYPNGPPGGVLQHYNGSLVDDIHTTAETFYDLWGASSTSVFAVGEAGTIIRFDGNAWTAMSSGTTNILFAVSGSGPSDVYAVGAFGTVLRFDGMAWSSLGFPHNAVLIAVWAKGPGDVFVGGSNGFLYHYDGARWAPVAPGGNAAILGLGGAGDTTVWFDSYGNSHRLVRAVPW